MIDALVAEVITDRFGLLPADLGELRIGPLVLTDGLSDGATMPNDVEIHGG